MKFKALVLGVVVLAAIADLRIAPPARPSTQAALAVVHLYQHTLSPLYARAGVRCRFTPTCSRYAEAVIGTWGIWRGGWLAARRLVRCGPWTPAGTPDPPPSRTAAARLP